MNFFFYFSDLWLDIAGFLLIGKSHHLRTTIHIIISPAGTASAEKFQKIFPVCILHAVFFSAEIKIQIFSVYRGNSCGITRLLHTPLDLQGHNTCLQNIRKNIQSTDIFKT